MFTNLNSIQLLCVYTYVHTHTHINTHTDTWTHIFYNFITSTNVCKMQNTKTHKIKILFLTKENFYSLNTKYLRAINIEIFTTYT